MNINLYRFIVTLIFLLLVLACIAFFRDGTLVNIVANGLVVVLLYWFDRHKPGGEL